MAKLLLAMVKKRSFKASSKISRAKRGKKEQKSDSFIIWKKKPVRNDTEDFDEVRVVLPLKKDQNIISEFFWERSDV